MLVRLEEREIDAQAEAAREKIAELNALLDGFDRAAEEIRITHKTLLELPDPGPPVPPAAKLPDRPAYSQIAAVSAAADAPLRARAVCEAMDVEIVPNNVNNVRLKAGATVTAASAVSAPRRRVSGSTLTRASLPARRSPSRLAESLCVPLLAVASDRSPLRAGACSP
ncbi:hypothetical protein ACFXGI_27685 [Streptomyces sp. NPDC059355]|uniref:hypothetical protein n=1 Tax=Streptomyces sp. NPDC059355 TaxID=3346811 RepID=UPI0036C64F9B